jgi:hypothetical protein
MLWFAFVMQDDLRVDELIIDFWVISMVSQFFVMRELISPLVAILLIGWCHQLVSWPGIAPQVLVIGVIWKVSSLRRSRRVVSNSS